MIDGHSLAMWCAGEAIKLMICAALIGGVVFGVIGFGIYWLLFA